MNKMKKNEKKDEFFQTTKHVFSFHKLLLFSKLVT